MFMLRYSHPLYRPPAESDNIILQATYGCSHNRCTFCTMYKRKKYEVRPIEELFREVDILSKRYPDANKIFLADGDALSLPTDYLLHLLKYLKHAFVKLSRVSVYATAQNLLEKSDEDLTILRENGLNLAYFGIETGNDELLTKINKGVDAAQMIEALHKASRAQIKISATVILGLGGKEFSEDHIRDTAKLINAAPMNYLSTLQLGLEEGALERFMNAFNSFEILNDHEILNEQRGLLSQLDLSGRIIFRSNHASNALHLAGTLPKDTTRLIGEIDTALKIGEGAFVPKYYRGF